MKLINIVSILFFFYVFHNNLHAESVSDTEVIEIEVKIVKHYYGILDEFPGGLHDGTVCTIIKPLDYKGKKMTIYHSHTVKPDSPWLDIGGIYLMRIYKSCLEKNHYPFDGAVKSMKKIGGFKKKKTKK